MPSSLDVTGLASSPIDDRIGTKMVTKPNDLTDAVDYHIGTFPPSALHYELLLGPLEEAAPPLRDTIRALSRRLVEAGLPRSCQRQSKSEPKGSVKCCHFWVGMIAA